MTAIGDNLTCMLDMSELQAAFICLVRVSTRSRTLKTDSPACAALNLLPHDLVIQMYTLYI